MGEHKFNTRAIAAAEPAPRFPPGTQFFGFESEVVIELNKEKLAEVVKMFDELKAKGEDPRQHPLPWTPDSNPEFFDYVVYNRPTCGRPSPLQIDPRSIPTARIRWSEHLRIPLHELKTRIDGAFAGAESREATH